MTLRHFTLALLLSLPISLFATDPADLPPEPAGGLPSTEEKAPKVIDDALRDVDEQAQKAAYELRSQLNKKGRTRGVFITTGSALIAAPINSPKWGDARALAFKEAQMKARENLMKMLYTESTSEIIRDTFNTNRYPEFTTEEMQTQSQLESMINKAVAYADAVLNNKLREQGIDPDEYAKAAPEKRKTMLRDAISETVRTRAFAELSGTMINRSYESIDKHNNMAISVVLLTSNKLKNTLVSIRESKGVMTPGEPGFNIEDFIYSNQKVLMNDYGLRLYRDENGYPVLLSFAHAGNDCDPSNYTECSLKRDFSFQFAYNSAIANFSEAFNLNGYSETDTFSQKNIETIATATRNTPSTTDMSTSTAQSIINESKSLATMKSSVKGLVGIHELTRWTEVHKDGKRELNGVVLAWRPEMESALRTFKAKQTPVKPVEAPTPDKESVNSGRTSNRFVMDDNDF